MRKRILSFILVLCLLPGLLGTALSGSLQVQAAAKDHSGITTIADPTKEEIAAKYAELRTPTGRFTTEPSVTAPYATGAVDPDYVSQYMLRLNYYRYVAKLPALEYSEAKAELAQYGAVLLGALNDLTHNPTKPSDMSSAFYEKGAKGAYQSNLSGYTFTQELERYGMERVESIKLRNMIRLSLLFQMRDLSPMDVNNVGHRRYLLSPFMKNVGFGMADSADKISSFYVLVHTLNTDQSLLGELNTNPNFDYVAWPPSGNCPSDLMEKTHPWTVTLNLLKYQLPTLADNDKVGDRTGITVTVTRQSDGRVWSFDANTPDGSAEGFAYNSYNAKFFNIDRHNYGYGLEQSGSSYKLSGNALVFRPDFEDDSAFEGVYNVKISGLKNRQGAAAGDIEYQVNFFNINDFVPCEHEWGEWEETTAPGCVEEGEETRTCALCGATETQPVPPAGHDWGEWLVSKNPTCTEIGQMNRQCNRCGEVETKDGDPALGHDWGEWMFVDAEDEPTCTEPGVETRSCNRGCGAEETREAPALGHNYQAVVTEPTCTEQGFTTYTCTRCGDSYVEDYTDALGHSFGEWTQTVAPSCTEKGEETRSCVRCDLTETREIEALGHDFADPVVTKEPTCTEAGEETGTCRRCGETTTQSIPALGHNWSEWTETKAPSCTEMGERSRMCARCLEKETEPIDMLPHTPGEPVEENYVPAGCTSDGSYDEVVYCTVCGNELSRTTKILPEIGHDWSDWTQTKAPNCTEAGEETRSCSICGETDTRPVEALGHDWDGGEMTQEPTCTEAGEMVYSCNRCDAVNVVPVAALGHDLGNWTETKAPTCTELGQETRSCSRCDYAESREKAAMGHAWDKGVVTKEATLQSEGVRTYTCTRCGAKRTEVIPKLVNTFEFDDVKNKKSFYYTPVYWAVSKGITKGTTDTTFEPNKTCTRAEVVTFLYRAAGSPTVDTSSPMPFTDVPAGAYYARAVRWAVANKITNGTSATTFEPGKTCTRGEVVTFLYRANNSPKVTLSNSFTDVPSKAFYARAVAWAVANKITNGKEAGIFAPNDTCTRGEVVTFLYRASK